MNITVKICHENLHVQVKKQYYCCSFPLSAMEPADGIWYSIFIHSYEEDNLEVSSTNETETKHGSKDDNGQIFV